MLKKETIAAEIFTFVVLSISFFEVLTSRGMAELVLRLGAFIFFLLFSILLIRHLLLEAREREELRALTRELEETNKRLKELDKLRREFLSFATHQVKSPLSVIKGYASLIMEGSLGKISPKVAGTVEKIKTASDRLIGLVDDILDLRRIEEGRMEYHFEGVSINEFVKNVVQEFENLARSKGLSISFTSLKNDERVSLDRQKFHQVVHNIIDNAIKYTDQGGISVEIRKLIPRSSGAGGAVVEIVIKDTGIGIAKELLPHLFQQFSRDRDVERYIRGTGLGLFISKTIVEAHRGEIWTESEGENKGSTFYIRLPVMP